jgi:osmotically-inducible protein OsmY
MRIAAFLFGAALSLVLFANAGALAQRGVDEPRPADSPQLSQPLPESSLTHIVREALRSESSLDSNRIQVDNKDGKITLEGSVDSDRQKEKAGLIVESVGGVKSVENDLQVTNEGEDETSSAGGTKPWER